VRRTLGATYRLQLGPATTFDDATGLVDYLATLGIECLYCSPVTEAVPGSEHGYDGTDPTRLRSELGGGSGFHRLAQALDDAGLGCVIDIVPNHLATDVEGPWWRDVLRHGESSEYADVFDINWELGEHRVLLPLIDQPVAELVRSNGIVPAMRGDEAVLMIGGLALPVRGGPVGPGDDVEEILAAQAYRLVDWHDHRSRNYRRFFDIDGLVGVRVERPEVFARTHALIAELAEAGLITGVRIDHVDGLRDPERYLVRLAELIGDLPIVIEKILTGDERLRTSWPVVGTTGYEVIDDIGGALVDPIGLEELARAAESEGEPTVDACTTATRHLLAETAFAGELARLAEALDVDDKALTEATTHLPVYRTYLDGSTEHPTDAAAIAAATTTEETASVREALEDPERLEATMSWQQLTGAVMAKGVEDTAWYRLPGKLAFGEVGGDPARSREDGVERLHARAVMRSSGPHSGLIPSTTHDTKRSGDTRARLYALSHRAGEFEAGLARFRDELRASVPADIDQLDDVLVEQSRLIATTALAILPPLRDAGLERDLPRRVREALVKGVREGKAHSSWDAPELEYEAALSALVDAALGAGAALVRRSFGPLVEELARLGATNSLTALVLRSTLPGVPDCYQGEEDWELSLVDPDNRRPVDYPGLLRRLDALGAKAGVWLPHPGNGAPLRRAWRNGDVKLAVTAACLHARRIAPAALAPTAPYLALAADGEQAASVLAFGRLADSRAQPGDPSCAVIAVVTRDAHGLDVDTDDLPAGHRSYGETELFVPDALTGSYVDALTGRAIDVEMRTPVARLLEELPVALLVQR